MTRPVVFLFGGQSSRDAAMFDRLEAVKPDSQARAWAGEFDPTFATNRGIQLSVMAAVLGWLEVAREAGIEAVASAGLSLGEYAHLVDIEALSAAEALRVCAARGALYDDGPSGCMAAIYPASWDELAPIVERVAGEGGARELAPAVFNSPTQTVVGGSREAVEAAIAQADEELYAVGTIVEERIPMHTARFEPVAQSFADVLATAQFGEAQRDYWSNVAAAPLAAEPETMRQRLTEHVYRPVRWRETVDALVAAHPDAAFLEIGPRTVLRDLLKRRWHPTLPVFSIDPMEADHPAAAVAATLREVLRA